MFDAFRGLGKSAKIVCCTLAIYIVLVATHKGEFWPFSIYPMFSQAGQPWERAIVQDISNRSLDNIWENRTKKTLPGHTVSIDSLNVNTNDIANYLSKTEVWTKEKQLGVRALVEKKLDSSTLIVYKARGMLTNDEKTKVKFIPYFYFTPDQTKLNKKLRTN